MTPNPALTPVPSQAQGQMTPVVRSSLQALRESRPQSGGGITSAASAVSAVPDAARTDEERSVTERLMEAGAQALKQERLAKKKLQALQKSRVGTWFEAILKFLLASTSSTNTNEHCWLSCSTLQCGLTHCR